VAICEFPKVPFGKYGISFLHDENGNGVLDTEIFRFPREGHGASNDSDTDASWRRRCRSSPTCTATR
jgi:uncharacterized protein (DUF2141 family)